MHSTAKHTNLTNIRSQTVITEDIDTERVAKAYDFAEEISESIPTKWMAYDIIFDEQENPVLLEISSSWGAWWAPSAPCFKKINGLWKKTGRTGGHMFDFAVEIMLDGICNE